MTFYIQYTGEHSRVIAGVVLESRQIIAATKNKSGFEVMDFFNIEIQKVTGDVIPYIVETETGSLAAYFSVKVTGVGDQSVGALYQLFIRPNFQGLTTDINGKIGSFIFNRDWRRDILFGESI